MEFIRSPRSTSARRWLFQLHLYAGIGVGLLLLVLGLSGAALVYSPELEVAPLWGAGSVPERLPVDLLAARVMGGRAGFRLQDIRFDVHGNATVFHLQRDQNSGTAGGDILLVVNPATGAVLKTVDRRAGMWHWLRDLHHNLLSGRTGRVANGVAAIFLLTLCVTGLAVWWPGSGRWKDGLAITQGAGWRRLTWDLHGVTGFWSAAMLAFMAFSAIQFAFPKVFENTVRFVTLSGKPPVRPNVTLAAGVPAASIESILDAARTAMPDGRAGFVKFPQKPGEPVEVRLKTAFDGRHDGNSRVFLHPASAVVLQVQRFDELSFGNRLLAMLGQIHMARFMSPGWASVAARSLWLLVGLAPGLLFLTGLLMWWNRVLRRKTARFSFEPLPPVRWVRPEPQSIGADSHYSRPPNEP